MSTFIDRINTELKELEIKFERLGCFLTTQIFLDLDSKNRELLDRQHDVMFEYINILKERIKLQEKV